MGEFTRYQYEVAGDATVDGHDCKSIYAVSPLGIETWLYVDKSTNQLIAAEQIDGTWFDLDIEYAKHEFKDVLYACL